MEGFALSLAMNIVVIGMGEAGKHVASVLVEEGHNVVVIDQSEAVLAQAEEVVDAMTLRGHGACGRVLRQANAGEADLVIALTDNDEVNLLAAIQAKHFGAKKVIARASSQAYFDDNRGLVKDMLGVIDLVVNPKMLVSIEMHKIVRSASAVAIEDFAENRIEMVQLAVGNVPKVLGKPLRDIALPEGTLLAAIDRGAQIIVPNGDAHLEIGDDILLVGRVEQVPEIERMFRRERMRFVHRVVVVGGSDIGEYVADALDRDNIQVVLIERDRARCYELAEKLGRNVRVINADGTNGHVLEDEGVERADVFIACSALDEVNLMASLLAKQLGAGRVIALVHKPDYAGVCERLGVDATLSPRLTVAQHVLKHVRGGRVLGIRPVLDGRGEFLEFLAAEGARVVGRPIYSVNFPSGANICAVLSGGEAYVPRGHDIIKPGDRVVVFSTPQQRGAVEKMFLKRRFFG